MTGPNKLTLSLLLSLTFISLTACKKGGSDSSRTTIRKAKAGGAQPQKNGKANDLDDKSRNQTLKTDPASDSARIEKDKNLKPEAEKEASNTVTCATLESSAKEDGWEVKSLDLPEEKVKVVYYVLKKSLQEEMKNPVVYFNRNAFQSMKVNDLKKFSNISREHQIDPILIDMRGSGCSSPTPDLKTKTSELNQYGSKFAVADAEKVRKILLKDRPWKILAHRSGGVVALKYAQLAPNGIESLHIADYVPVQNQTTLAKFRMAQESAVFEKIMVQEKLTEELVNKALKNLDSDKLCKGFTSCRVLLDLYGGMMMSYKSQWTAIGNLIKSYSENKSQSTELIELLEKRKADLDLSSVARVLDLHPFEGFSACSDAIKKETPGIINSCRMEVTLGTSSISGIKNLNHDPLDLQLIKTNLIKHDIPYTLYSGSLSTIYPPEAFEQHEKEMGDILGPSYYSLEMGSEVSESPEFLGTLKM